MPPGWTKTRSGLAVSADVASVIADRRTRDIVRFYEQAPTIAGMSTGLNESERRGQDLYSEGNRQRMAASIETLRERNPLIYRMVDYFTRLALKEGMSVGSEEPAIDAIAKRIWSANNMDDNQQRWLTETFQSGMFVGRVVADELRPAIPAWVIYPTSQVKHIAMRNGMPWYYTIEWREGQYVEPRPAGVHEGRSLQYAGERWYSEDIPAEQIVLVSISVGAKDVRGISPLQTMIKWAILYGRSLESQHLLTIARSMLALHIKLGGADINDPQVVATRDYIEGLLVDRTDLDGFSYKTMPTGQILVTGDQVEMQGVSVMGNKASADSSETETRRLLLMAAVGPGAPEVFLGDGNFANLASADAQSNPFFQIISGWQQAAKREVRGMMRLSFDALVRSGAFPQSEALLRKHNVEHLADLVQVHAPDIMAPSIEKLGPVAAQLVASKTWSRQYANKKMGTDITWEEMSHQIDEEIAAGYVSDPIGNQPGLPLAIDPKRMPMRVKARERIHVRAEEEVRHEETEGVRETAAQAQQRLNAEFMQAVVASKGDATIVAEARRIWRERSQQLYDATIDAGRSYGRLAVSPAA